MYGLNHRYCQNCGHAVRYGRSGCGGCGTSFGDLMMLDMAMDQDMCGPSIGFDPMDGQMVINEGGFGFEPGSGQVDIDFGGIDFPI
jgi:hypothetical protein